MHRPAPGAKRLVVPSRVESQGAEQHSVGRDDADVSASDQEVDLAVSVPGPDGDVSESAQVAQCDLAVVIDAVAADAVVGGRLEGFGACFETGVEGFYRGPSAEGAVRSDMVVVLAEVVQLKLQLSDGFSRRLLAEVELEGLVQALNLAAGLRLSGQWIHWFDLRSRITPLNRS